MEIIVEKINVSHMAEGFLGTDFPFVSFGFFTHMETSPLPAKGCKY